VVVLNAAISAGAGSALSFVLLLRFTELSDAAWRLPAPGGARAAGIPSRVAKQVTGPVRNGEAPAPAPQLA